MEKAVKDKHSKYRDVAASPLAELVVLGCEVGGRWHEDAIQLVRLLAKEKAKTAHPLLRRSVELAWTDRWWCKLGTAVQDALAASLLAHSGKRLVLNAACSTAPQLDEVLDCQRWAQDLEQEEEGL